MKGNGMLSALLFFLGELVRLLAFGVGVGDSSSGFSTRAFFRGVRGVGELGSTLFRATESSLSELACA